MKNTNKHEKTHMDHSHPQYILGSADLEVDFPLGKSTTSSTHMRHMRVMENPAFSSLLANHEPLCRIYPLVMTNSLRTWTWPSRNSRITHWTWWSSIAFCLPKGNNPQYIRTVQPSQSTSWCPHTLQVFPGFQWIGKYEQSKRKAWYFMGISWGYTGIFSRTYQPNEIHGFWYAFPPLGSSKDGNTYKMVPHFSGFAQVEVDW